VYGWLNNRQRDLHELRLSFSSILRFRYHRKISLHDFPNTQLPTFTIKSCFLIIVFPLTVKPFFNFQFLSSVVVHVPYPLPTSTIGLLQAPRPDKEITLSQTAPRTRSTPSKRLYYLPLRLCPPEKVARVRRARPSEYFSHRREDLARDE